MDTADPRAAQQPFRPLDEKTDEQRFLDQELARVRTAYRHQYNAELAAVLSLIIPGAGQFYLQQRGLAAVLFGASVVLFKLVFPWVLCAVGGAFAAYATARRLNGQRSAF